MKRFFVWGVFALSMLPLCAQQKDDRVLFEIGTQKITASEFRHDFLRSIGQDESAAPTMCTYEKRQKIEEYAQLFLNFRTKLYDAFALGYDTLPSLCRELATYRGELAQPYLMDSATLMQIMQEAYERNQYALHASHILIRLEGRDTAGSFQLAMEAYRRASAGEDFNELASEMNMRQLPDEERAKYRKKPMEGDLGCFTAFDMIYPFESAAYALKPGEVSKPIRTRYGYHVIKLYSKTPFYGPVTLRHIWVSEGGNSRRAEARIRDAYQSLQSGSDFAEVYANVSDDASSERFPGGLMSGMMCTQLPPDYVEHLADLQPGAYSEPFHTSFGWHIVMLEHRDTIPSLSSLMPLYKQRMSRDSRNTMPREEFIARNLEKYNFIDYTQTPGTWKKTADGWQFVAPRKGDKKAMPASSLDAVVAIATDSLFDKRWIFDSNELTDHRPLMELDGRRYTTDDFCRFMALNQQLGIRRNLATYVQIRYDNFIGETLMQLVDSRLEQDNPDFAELMNEYRHGLMIFAYNDDKIWKVASADSAGLQHYYAGRLEHLDYDNPDDEVYFWNSRARTTVYTIADSAMLHPDKARKVLKKAEKKHWDVNRIREELQNAVSGKNAQVTSHLELFEDQHQTALSNNEWRQGFYIHPEGKGYQIFAVEKILPPMAKELGEARGYYLNDYQNELEHKLLMTLRDKYHVVMHQEVLDDITY